MPAKAMQALADLDRRLRDRVGPLRHRRKPRRPRRAAAALFVAFVARSIRNRRDPRFYLVVLRDRDFVIARGQITRYRAPVAEYLSSLHLAPQSPAGMQMLAKTLGQQVQLAAFVDAFWLVAASFVAMLPLLLFIRRTTAAAAPPQGAMAD
ncbi:MAG: hypothetical protein ABI585_02235 [Betaproteobacteria bacterium]